MRLSRKQSIFASIGILLFFFIGVALLRPKTASLPTKDPSNLNENSNKENIANPNSDKPASGPDFVLDNFKREEMKNGKKIWEVKASRGRYNPGGGQAYLENSTLWLYKKDGGLVTLKSDKAILKLEGSEGLSAADFSGNVVITQDNTTTLETDQASYDKTKDLVTAPNLVKVTGDKMQLEGIGMEVTVSTKDIKLLKQTKTLIEPKEKTDTPSTNDT